MQEIHVDNKRLVKNTMYLYARMVVMLIVSLYTTRLTYRILGVDNYGLYNVVGSIIVFFTFINQALNTATRRYITAEIALGDDKSRKNVFNMALFSHGIIAVIILVLAETIGLFLVNHVLNIPGDRLHASNIVYQISILTAVVSIMQSPYTAIITAYERMSIYAYLSVLEVFLKLTAVALLYYVSGDKLVVYSIVIFLSTFLMQVLYRVFCKRKFHECTLQKPHGRQLFKEMFSFMGWNLLGQGAAVATNQSTTVLVNVFFNVAANAAMGISNQITGVVSNFVHSFQIAFHPQITKLYVCKNYEELSELCIRCTKISSFLVLLFMVPIVFQTDTLLQLWLGDYPQYAVEFCFFTLLCLYIDSVAAPLWMLILSDTDIKGYQITISVILTCTILIGWLVLHFGAPPYAIMLVKAFVCFNALIYRIYKVKSLVNVFPLKQWVVSILIKPLLIIVIPCFIMFLLDFYTFESILLGLFLKTSTCLIFLALGIYVVGLNASERKQIKTIVSNKFNNHHK